MSADLYRERIEVNLDGRQIFYLFIGGAVMACLVFVLGVMVGRRVESRTSNSAMVMSDGRDPLAALDRMQQRPNDLRFRKALRERGAEGAVQTADKQILATAKAAESAAALPPSAATKPSVVTPPPTAVATEVAKPTASIATALPVVVPPAAPQEAPVSTMKHFTPKAGDTFHALRVSSFEVSAQAEAEAYIKKLKGSGYAPYTVEIEQNGKKYIRVLVGRYPSREAALEAKDNFEKKYNKIAYLVSF